jgi:hypothetical protein
MKPKEYTIKIASPEEVTEKIFDDFGSQLHVNIVESIIYAIHEKLEYVDVATFHVYDMSGHRLMSLDFSVSGNEFLRSLQLNMPYIVDLEEYELAAKCRDTIEYLEATKSLD